ncbi:MAG: hypothetical protein ACR2QH_10925, partial [Geminicoccaceae bacterium]
MESQNSIRLSVSEGPRRVQIVQVDQAVETDTAFDVTPVKIVAIDQAVETDIAFQVRPFHVWEAISPGRSG